MKFRDATRTVIAVLLALLSAPGFAATWFFRADNGTGYGQKTGASYANAWHLDDRHTDRGHVDWRLIKPGDTLFVCGYHHTGRDRSLRPTVSGLAGRPIVIDGNCPSGFGPDRGILVLAAAEFTDGWSGAASGAYSRSYPGSTGGQLLEDTDNAANGTAGLKRLVRRTGTPNSGWSCGSFSQAPGGGRLYYKPSDADGNGRCDLPHPTYTLASDSISFVGVGYITLRNLTLMHQDRVINLQSAQNIVIENNDIRWATSRGIRVSRNSDGGLVTGNRIRDVQSGIYLENQVDYNNADNMDQWVISGNEIFNVDQDCYYACQVPRGQSADTHGIAFQGGSGNRIERNHIHHVGGEGIIFYSTRRQTLRDNTIQYNFVHDVKDLNPDTAAHPERSEQAIVHGGSGEDIADNTVNNVVRYNVLAGIDQTAIRIKSSKPTTGYSWSVLNNVIYRAGRSSFAFAAQPDSGSSPGNLPGFRFRNNISVSPARRHIEQLVGRLPGDTSGIDIANNLFFPDNTPGVLRYDWAEGAYEAVAVWSSVSGRAGGAAGDPRFVDPAGTFRWSGTPATIPGAGDFRLQPSSPAINTGADLGASGLVDLNGDPVLVRRDIGAYETPTDLEVFANSSPQRAKGQGTSVYGFTVRNGGPGLATGVAFSAGLPAGTRLLSASVSQGSCRTDTLVRCSLGSIPATVAVTVSLTIEGPGAANVLTAASVAASEFDPDIGNNLTARPQAGDGSCSVACHR